MADATIVAVAYNRPDALRTLLASVARADVPSGTDLIISIDGGGTEHDAVAAIADAAEWTLGTKRIIDHEPLGLVEHFLRCGDLTETVGNVIHLEDDLIVGPGFHRWAIDALRSAESDERIAGVSLAHPWFDGYRHLRFEPVIDGSDGIYMQVPWYDGMAWTPAMWSRFRNWEPDPRVAVHRLLHTLDADWFPTVTRYLVATDRCYLMPREAHATNTGAAGAHFDTVTDWFQTPITVRGRQKHHLTGLDQSLAVYDDHMELTPDALHRIVPDLAGRPICVDLLGVRDLDRRSESLVLTTRAVTAAVRSWGASLHPLVANLVYDVAGDAIHLAERVDVRTDNASDAGSLATLQRHEARGREVGGRDGLRAVARSARRRIRRG